MFKGTHKPPEITVEEARANLLRRLLVADEARIDIGRYSAYRDGLIEGRIRGLLIAGEALGIPRAELLAASGATRLPSEA